jgi:NAD(P)-dependent dehydrogenase (short-subunit alcohol dehydrogenase family)
MSTTGEGEAVLITGASSGIGLEAAVYLAERGFHVYATMRDLGRRDPLDAEARRRNVKLEVLDLDVRDEAAVDRVVRAVVAECGGLYGLVNNAGIQSRGYFEDLSEAEIRRVFETNLFGGMTLVRAVLPHMRTAHRGRIVIITSVGGRIGSPGLTAYCASKFALEGFGEALALEMALVGVQVILLEPGIIKTELWGKNRGIAARALDPGSPYYAWFNEWERLADRLVAASRTRPVDVARAVHRALTVRRPKLRYVVGRKAAIAVALRRYLPGELFERFYFAEVARRVTRAGHR